MDTEKDEEWTIEDQAAFKKNKWKQCIQIIICQCLLFNPQNLIAKLIASEKTL